MYVVLFFQYISTHSLDINPFLWSCINLSYYSLQHQECLTTGVCLVSQWRGNRISFQMVHWSPCWSKYKPIYCYFSTMLKSTMYYHQWIITNDPFETPQSLSHKSSILSDRKTFHSTVVIRVTKLHLPNLIINPGIEVSIAFIKIFQLFLLLIVSTPINVTNPDMLVNIVSWIVLTH